MRESTHRQHDGARPNAARQVLGGSSLGLLVGLIMGLTINPLAASVVGSLMALLVGYSAIKPSLPAALTPARDQTAPEERSVPVIPGSLIGFSLAAVLALLTGIYVRTHSLLSPTPQQITARWEAAGLSREAAVQIALATFDLPHARPSEPARTPAEAAQAPRQGASAVASVLHAGSVSLCDELKQKLTAHQSIGALAQAFADAGGEWESEFQRVNGSERSDDDKRAALDAFVDAKCWGGRK